MGWLFGWYDRRSMINELVKDQLCVNPDGTKGPAGLRTLAHTCVGNSLWAVCERTYPAGSDKKPYRFIALFLMRRGGPGDWGYKDLDESCGPCEVSCPLSYLEMAPEGPHLGEYAVAWRRSVREYWAKRHEAQKFAKTLRPGDRFAYGWGNSPSVVTFVSLVGKNWIVGKDDRGRMYRYSRSKARPLNAGSREEPGTPDSQTETQDESVLQEA